MEAVEVDGVAQSCYSWSTADYSVVDYCWQLRCFLLPPGAVVPVQSANEQ